VAADALAIIDDEAVFHSREFDPKNVIILAPGEIRITWTRIADDEEAGRFRPAMLLLAVAKC
jgi:hypothetical protein